MMMKRRPTGGDDDEQKLTEKRWSGGRFAQEEDAEMKEEKLVNKEKIEKEGSWESKKILVG